MDEADKLCERIAIMDHGKILVNNTSAELKKMIPGGNALEIRVFIPDAAGVDAHARLKGTLEGLPGVTKVDEMAAEPAPALQAAAATAGPWATFAPPAASAPVDDPGISTYRLYAESAGTLTGAAAQAVLASGAEVRDLHLKQATLEEVFIYLTGRHLR